jgi:hypothetical protein
VSEYIITCPCGQTTLTHTGISVAATMDDTGFLAVMLDEGSILYLCPECAARAQWLARELLEIVGTLHFYLPSLEEKLPKPRRQPGE